MLCYGTVNNNLSIYVDFVRKHIWEVLKLREHKPIIDGLSFQYFFKASFNNFLCGQV